MRIAFPLLCLLSALSAAVPARADESAFLKSLAGNWTGGGTVVMMLVLLRGAGFSSGRRVLVFVLCLDGRGDRQHCQKAGANHCVSNQVDHRVRRSLHRC